MFAGYHCWFYRRAHVILRSFRTLSRVAFSFLLILVSWVTPAYGYDDITAMELNDELSAANELSIKAPLKCIEMVDAYLGKNKSQLQQTKQGFVFNDSFSLASNNNSSIVNAFQIKSKCYKKLKNIDQALVNIEIAIELAQTSSLPFELAQAKLSYGSLLFNHTQRHVDALLEVQQASLQADSSSHPLTHELQLSIHLALADFYTQKDKFQQANQELESAKTIANKLDKPQLIAWLNYYWGRYYIRISQPQLALSHFVDAKSMAENAENFLLIAKATYEIADIYRRQGNKLDKALHYANLSANAYQDLGDDRELAYAQIYMAILHRQNQEYSLSMVYFWNAGDLLQGLQDLTGSALCNFEMGKTFLKMHSVDEARNYLNLARFQYSKMDNTKMLADTLLLLGRLNIEQGEAGIARIQLEKVLALSESLSFLEQRERAYELLAAAYELTGHYKKAIENFKQFHALQTKIKQLEFTLEQNKFNEQYQLIERTQQITVLEQDNQKLTSKLEGFLMVCVVIATVLLVLLYRYIHNWLKLKQLKAASQTLITQLNHHPHTLLPWWSSQLKSEQFNKPRETTLPQYYALISINFLTDLYEKYGALKAQRIEKEFGVYLQTHQPDQAAFYQMRDNQLLFITHKTEDSDAESLAQFLTDILARFTHKYDLAPSVAIGIVNHPFLPKAEAAIDHKRVSDLACLALLGAKQIQTPEESAWLELFAIDCPQAAFFNGDIWQLGQQAIAKGLVKINCSGDKSQLVWPIIQASNNMKLKPAF